jgi:hypothetical protein
MEHRPISWPAVRAELADLLDTAERDGAAGARRWLQARTAMAATGLGFPVCNGYRRHCCNSGPWASRGCSLSNCRAP